MPPPRPSTDPVHRLLRGARATLLSLVGFSLVINLLLLTLPMYMMQLFDRVLASQSEQTLAALTVAALLALAFMAAMERIRAKLMIRAGDWLDRTLSPLLYTAGFTARRGARHARNLARLRGFLTGPGAFAMLDAPWTPLFLAAVFLIHPLLGAVALSAAAAIFALAWLNDWRSRAPLHDALAASQTARRRIEAVGRQADTVAAMGMQAPMRTRWLNANDAALSAQTRANDGIAAMVVASRFARMAAQVLTMALAMHLVIGQEIGLGGMIATSLILSRALSPVEQALGQWRAWGEARDAWRDIAGEIAAHTPAPLVPLATPSGRLSVDGAAFTPPGRDRPLFSGIELSLAPGTFAALNGPSGSGKSTLMRLLAGVAAPDGGDVRLDGAPFGPATGYRFAAHVGYVPQAVAFLPGTVADNIARFTDAPADKVVQAARRAGAHEFILSLPNGYDTPLGTPDEPVSAGGRQRIALARALFGEPRLLVLDEPYSNLDDDGVAALMTAVFRFRAAGGTTVMVAQRPSVTARADRTFTLDGGTLRETTSRDARAPRPIRAGGRP